MPMTASALTVLAGLYLAACVIAFGRHTPGYRHASKTISELGEVGAPHQRAVAFGVFLPVGLLVLAAAGLLQASSRAAAALAGCLAVGYVGAALFPCDPGSPASGSARQAVHNLAGGIEYIGGGAALLALSPAHGEAYRWLGFAAFGAAALLTVLPGNSVRGLVQRVAEAGLFGGLAIVAAGL